MVTTSYLPLSIRVLSLRKWDSSLMPINQEASGFKTNYDDLAREFKGIEYCIRNYRTSCGSHIFLAFQYCIFMWIWTLTVCVLGPLEEISAWLYLLWSIPHTYSHCWILYLFRMSFGGTSNFCLYDPKWSHTLYGKQ